MDTMDLKTLFGGDDSQEFELFAHVIIKRRGDDPGPEPGPKWTMLKHNAFDTYVFFLGSNGNQWSVLDDGAAAECTSNGLNQNNSQFYISRRFTYDDIKDKTCRITWTVESDDIQTMDKTNSFGNIQLLLLTNQTQTSGNLQNYRKAKVDIATESNFLGHHSLEFVPSELFAGQTTGQYFGWNIGFRTNVSGQKIRVTQFDFEVLEDDTNA